MNFSTQYFRASVGAIITNHDNTVLIFEREDIPGAWQFPQGGLEISEEPNDAVYREIEEETSIKKDSLRLIETFPQLLAYELPQAMRTEKTGRGQVQYWYLLHAKKDLELEINLDQSSEFTNWKWVTFDQIVGSIAEFRKPTYSVLSKWYARVISDSTM